MKNYYSTHHARTPSSPFNVWSVSQRKLRLKAEGRRPWLPGRRLPLQRRGIMLRAEELHRIDFASRPWGRAGRAGARFRPAHWPVRGPDSVVLNIALGNVVWVQQVANEAHPPQIPTCERFIIVAAPVLIEVRVDIGTVIRSGPSYALWYIRHWRCGFGDEQRNQHPGPGAEAQVGEGSSGLMTAGSCCVECREPGCHPHLTNRCKWSWNIHK
jgi:hypothetical protein